jgi:hypothetical protein
MIGRSQRLLGGGDQGYFSEEGPVNLRVDAAQPISPSSLPTRGALEQYRLAIAKRAPWLGPSGRLAG